MFSETKVCLEQFGTPAPQLWSTCSSARPLLGSGCVCQRRDYCSRCDRCTCALGGEHCCTGTLAITSLVTSVTGDRKHLAVKTLGV